MMDRRLNENEIQYLLDHLEPLYGGTRLKPYLKTFVSGPGRSGTGQDDPAGDDPGRDDPAGPALCFPLSDKALKFSEVLRVDDIPVLFPCSKQARWYSLKGKQIHFHHDILKSAFFLLSGYQEHRQNERDEHGRFPWHLSVQYKLGITQKPVVNYYFEVILEAFGEFCQLNKLEFIKKERDFPLLFLSHDVDRIKKYTLRNLAIVTLQLLGIKKSRRGFNSRLKLFAQYARGTLLFKKNPYWTFEEIYTLEEELHISSTWFFLEKTRMDNSRYQFSQEKIRALMGFLAQKGHEIGLHGTLESAGDLQSMEGGIQRLKAACQCPVWGIRQHFLSYHMPVTPRLQEAAGLDYDASLGFAEQPGFRNSYAYPFRLYDFEQQTSRRIWQLPLNVMEASLLEYMDVQVNAFYDTLEPLLAEVARFKGVFSLLWHNCRLDEEETPGIKKVYRKVLEDILQMNFVPVTGREAVNAFRTGDASGNSS